MAFCLDRCSLSRDTGPCRAHHERWFYDQSDGYCKQFVYGGCAGNKNRFDSEPACREACDANLPIGNDILKPFLKLFLYEQLLSSY